jgi:hypothetical protein
LPTARVAVSPLEALAAELAADMDRIERDLKMSLALEVERLRAERAEFELRVERAVAVRLALLKDGATGPPGEPGAPAEVEAPDEVAPLVAKALSLMAEAPPLLPPQPSPPVVNVTVPAARTERSRVKHDEHGRIVEIERDVA